MIEGLMIPKDELLYLDEEANCQEAVELLEKYNERNLPILDSSGTMYRGNIYRYHIYKHKFHHPEDDLQAISVTRFLKNTTKTVHLGESLYHLFFKIRDLPYIAVLDESHTFQGIIRHDAMTDFLAESLAIQETGYILEVELTGNKRELTRLRRIIQRFSEILSSSTMQGNPLTQSPVALFTLPDSLDLPQINRLKEALDWRKFKYKLYKM